jgi:hypothetical protein
VNYHALCFVDMPFGQKSDRKSGLVVDFDQICNEGIKPAIEQCALEPLHGDEECTGGMIHSAIFARLADFGVCFGRSYAGQCERLL